MSSTPTSGSFLSRTVELARAGDVPAALDELQDTSTFELRAAYAYAIRRRAEGQGYHATSELLEVALLARRRAALRGARWYDRPEIVFPLWFGLWALLQWVRSASLGWTAALLSLLVTAAVILLVWRTFTRRQRTGPHPVASIADQSRTELERVSGTAEAILRVAEEDETATADTFIEVARRRARGLGEDLAAAAALARAERTLSSAFDPVHRRARSTVAEARTRAIGRLDEEIRARLR